MTWRDDLASLGRIRDRLAGSEHLAPDEVAKLAGQADALVTSARSMLRHSEATVEHLERALTPQPPRSVDQAADNLAGSGA